MSRSQLLRSAALCSLLSTSPVFAQTEIEIATPAELREALAVPHADRTIHLRAGRYVLEAPLVVSDGTKIAGSGVMRFDSAGLPVGFEPGTQTLLVASERLDGDVVTLGDGAVLRNLQVEGSLRAANDDRPAGNVVMLASRSAGDRLRATVSECEIINHSEPAYDEGPAGRAVVVITQNPDTRGAWHEGAAVSATIARSIVRNVTTGISVFAVNFASHGTLELDLERNRLEGTVGVAGGAGKPDRVGMAKTVLRSRGNLYISPAGGSDAPGWQIIGGSPSPHHAGTEGAVSNSVEVDSSDDRIEGFLTGLVATAARPIVGMPGLVARNRVELMLNRMTVRTVGTGAADLSLHGALTVARSDSPPPKGRTVEPAPEHNVLTVTIVDSTGSGQRDNAYSNSYSPDAATPPGQSNRLEVTGSLEDFVRRNRSLDPPPDGGFFLESDAAESPP